jgi:hypothetical protein
MSAVLLLSLSAVAVMADSCIYKVQSFSYNLTMLRK